jgi:hypothetical protein
MLLLMLRAFPPATSSLYPRCPVFRYLHLLCPGCGGTRAIAALMHCDLAAAWHWNALIVGTLPFTLWFLGLTYWRALKPMPFGWPRVGRPMLGVLLLLTGAFTVLRNI